MRTLCIGGKQLNKLSLFARRPAQALKGKFMHSPDGNHWSISATLPKLKTEPPGESYSYLGVASRLLPGAESLCAAKVDPPNALAFLCCHILECILKGALVLKVRDNLKDKAIRHNLVRLWDLAVANNLPFPMPHPAWLPALSEMHDDPYILRYARNINGWSFPILSDIPRELRSLLELVHQMQRDHRP